MQRIDRALAVAATAAAFLLLAVVIATAGEREKSLERVNEEIREYWQQWRAESDRRSDLYLQQQQLEALRGIEANTAEGE